MLSTLLAGLGLSFSAGLNAYLPLLILALADRFTDVVELDQPYDILSSNLGLIILLLILPIELILDKIPRLDHMNDLVHTAIRPISGAVAFMAFASQSTHLHSVVALVIGLLVAGGIHGVKSSNRPHISQMTKGIGNPFISIVEDGIVIMLALLAIFVPVSVVIVLPLFAWLLLRSYRRMRSGETRLMALLGTDQGNPTSQ